MSGIESMYLVRVVLSKGKSVGRPGVNVDQVDLFRDSVALNLEK